jgi:hypothetical protein
VEWLVQRLQYFEEWVYRDADLTFAELRRLPWLNVAKFHQLMFEQGHPT